MEKVERHHRLVALGENLTVKTGFMRPGDQVEGKIPKYLSLWRNFDCR